MPEHSVRNAMGRAATKRLPCSVCGLDAVRREGWYVVLENRWLDRLSIFTWDRSLALQQGYKSACGRQHLKVLIGYWLEQASFRNLTCVQEPIPIAGDYSREPPELGPKAAGHLIGDLSVFRDFFSRVWTGSPETLGAIVDALIPSEDDGDPSLANKLQTLPHQPRWGLSLQEKRW